MKRFGFCPDIRNGQIQAVCLLAVANQLIVPFLAGVCTV